MRTGLQMYSNSSTWTAHPFGNWFHITPFMAQTRAALAVLSVWAHCVRVWPARLAKVSAVGKATHVALGATTTCEPPPVVAAAPRGRVAALVQTGAHEALLTLAVHDERVLATLAIGAVLTFAAPWWLVTVLAAALGKIVARVARLAAHVRAVPAVVAHTPDRRSAVSWWAIECLFLFKCLGLMCFPSSMQQPEQQSFFPPLAFGLEHFHLEHVEVVVAPRRDVVAAAPSLLSSVGVVGVGFPPRDATATSATTASAAARAKATAITTRSALIFLIYEWLPVFAAAEASWYAITI